MVKTFDGDCGGSLTTAASLADTDCVLVVGSESFAADEEILGKSSLVCFESIVAPEAHLFICRVQLDI